ncbi:MAG: hypothetical protein WAV51_00820 [Microgenomates group bacterium]
MKLVKKINAVFISLIVGMFYIFIIPLAWIIHKTTKHPRVTVNSYWRIPDLKKLPKQYFSSPY